MSDLLLEDVNTLTFAPGDATWHKLRERGKNDFYFFVSVVMGMADKIPMRAHFHKPALLLMSGTTGIADLDLAPYKMVRMPRDTGKSACITKPLPIWRLARNPRLNILLAAQKVDLAQKFLDYIKSELLTNDLLRSLYPEITPDNPLTKALFPHITRWERADLKWNADEIEIPDGTGRGEPNIKATGVGGSVTGSHPGLIICDDLIAEDEAQAAKAGNLSLMKGAIDWVNRLDALLDKNAKPVPEVCVVGTSWWVGDVYDYLESTYAYGEARRKYRVTVTTETGVRASTTMWRAGDIAVHVRSAIEDGRPTLAERWSAEKLAKFRIRDPVLFAANLMNRPSDEVTAAFKESWLKRYTWLDPYTIRYPQQDLKESTVRVQDLDIVIAVDPGGFGGSSWQMQDRMRAACIVSATAPDETHLLLVAHSQPETYMEFAEALLTYIERYKPRKVGIEQAGQQIVFIDLIRRMIRERGLNAIVEPLKPGTKDKATRILELEPYLQRGQVAVGPGAEWMEFLEQYRQFPQNQRVDLLDAMANLPQLWRKPVLGASGTSLVDLNRQARDKYRKARGYR